MPQSKKPTGVIDIVAASWKNLTVNLKLYLEFTIWSVAIGLALWLMTYIIGQAVSDQLMFRVTMLSVSIPFYLVFMVITVAIIHATWQTLSRKKATFRKSMVVGLKMLIPFIWLSILTGLVFLVIPAAVIGTGFFITNLLGPFLAQHFWLYVIIITLMAAVGGAMIMIPIYYLLPIYFSANFLTIDNIRGWACLKRCAQLVRGRWWKAFWRLVVPGVFFWLTIQFTLKISYLLFGSILGDPGILFGVGVGNGGFSLLRGVIVLIVAEFIYGISAPLFVGANLIVWNDLKRFEGKE